MILNPIGGLDAPYFSIVIENKRVPVLSNKIISKELNCHNKSEHCNDKQQYFSAPSARESIVLSERRHYSMLRFFSTFLLFHFHEIMSCSSNTDTTVCDLYQAKSAKRINLHVSSVDRQTCYWLCCSLLFAAAHFSNSNLSLFCFEGGSNLSLLYIVI